MKSLTVRLPEDIVARIEDEARKRKMSKSDVVRERLSHLSQVPAADPWKDTLAHVTGAIDGLPYGDSRNIKAALKASGYGRKRPR